MKHKMKKIVVMLIALALVLGSGGLIFQQYSAASALSDAREAASEHVPSTASIQKEEKNDDEFYFQYFDAAHNETFDIYVDRKDYSQIRLLSRVDNTGGSEKVDYSRDEIINLVKTHYTGVDVQSVALVEGYKGFVYEVFFTGDNVRGQLSVNPLTGVIIERSLRLGNPMLVIRLNKDDDLDDYTMPHKNIYISFEEARLIALEHIPDARIEEMDYDDYNGRLAIEIRMNHNTIEYEMKIDAQSGEILKLDKDDISLAARDRDNNRYDQSDNDSDEAAFSEGTASSQTSQSESTTNPTEQAGTETETTKTTVEAPTTTTETKYTAPQLIGTAKVKQIILDKVPGATIIELELDWDDGRVYYEGEAVDSKYEYEFEIDGYTGALVNWERDDRDDDDYRGRGSFIGLEAAKEIALSYVPGGKIVEIELDEDDDRYYYEIEMYKGEIEYELEIDAYTGALIEWEIDD